MTVYEALKSCVGYPVPQGTIEAIAVRRGLYGQLQEEVTTPTMESKAYALCEADIMKFVAMAPNVSEAELSVSMNDRDILIGTANAIYTRYGEPLIGAEAVQSSITDASDRW
jgi:hypothetical protein